MQLALVHAGVTITVVPVTSTLNRIMIADLHMSAFFVSFLVALPYLLSPLQVLIGNWADQNPLWGRHRSPWILLGGLMAAFGGYFTAHSLYWMQASYTAGLLTTIVIFLLWGTGVNIASVSYLSLVSDLSEAEPRWRSRAVSAMWTVMIIFIILTSITLSRLLQPFSREALYTAFGLVWAIACAFIFFGCANLEPPPTAGRTLQNKADNPLLAFRLLVANRSAQQFFVFMLVVLISIYAQDVVLEPFGARALQMPVGSTARLTSIWGVGLLITLLLGAPLVRRFGKKSCAAIGALIAAGAFAGVIISGLLPDQRLFMSSVFLVGLGCGLLTVSSLSLMLDMTVPQAAGLYMGAWGVANFVGRALGNLSSGLVSDLVQRLTGDPVMGYMAVFLMEIVGMLWAVWLLRTISVEAFRQDAELRLQDVLALAGD